LEYAKIPTKGKINQIIIPSAPPTKITIQNIIPTINRVNLTTTPIPLEIKSKVKFSKYFDKLNPGVVSSEIRRFQGEKSVSSRSGSEK
jgi:hypothetical protein